MKEHQTFRLSPEHIELSKSQAEKENRSLSNLYETAIVEYLTRAGAIRKKSKQTKKKK